MTPRHWIRLAAFGIGAFGIGLALWTQSGEGPLRPAADRKRPKDPKPEPTPKRASAPSFTQRNPFQFVRSHPPPAPPPTVETQPSLIPKPPPVQAIPERPLPLKLKGTIAGSPYGIAFLIRTDKGSEMVLSMGDSLEPHLGPEWSQTLLAEVERKRVVFRRGTKSYVLDLEGVEETPEPVVAVATPEASPSAPPEPTAPAGGPVKTLQRDQIRRNLSNLGFLVTQLNVQPFFSNGRPSGFRVSRIRPGSFVDKLGARNGDIVQGVNGKPIRTIKDAFHLYNSFKSDESVKVEVLRGGKPTTMTFQIR